MRTVEVDLWVMPASNKAWKVSRFSPEGSSADGVFLPRSQVSNFWPLTEGARQHSEPGQAFGGWRVEIPEWLAREKGLIDGRER